MDLLIIFMIGMIDGLEGTISCVCYLKITPFLPPISLVNFLIHDFATCPSSLASRFDGMKIVTLPYPTHLKQARMQTMNRLCPIGITNR